MPGLKPDVVPKYVPPSVQEKQEALRQAILSGLKIMGAKGIAAGYLQGLELRIEDLERKVAAMQKMRKVRR